MTDDGETVKAHWRGKLELEEALTRKRTPPVAPERLMIEDWFKNTTRKQRSKMLTASMKRKKVT